MGTYLDEENISTGFSEGDSDSLANAPRAACYKSSMPFEREDVAHNNYWHSFVTWTVLV